MIVPALGDTDPKGGSAVPVAVGVTVALVGVVLVDVAEGGLVVPRSLAEMVERS